MNSILLDILTDTELRDVEKLEDALIMNTSAGLPWLTVQEQSE